MMLQEKGLLAAFVALGVTAAGIPAALPAASEMMAADLLNAVPALFGGLLTGVIASGIGMRVIRPTRVLIVGCVLQGASLTMAAVTAMPSTFIVASAIAGFGFGLAEASGTVLAKRSAGQFGTAVRLSALTGAVAVAAACTPLVMLITSAFVPFQLVLVFMATVPLGAAALLLVASTRGDKRSVPRGSMPQSPGVFRGAGPRAVLALVPFAIALPIYVGVETIFAGWSAVLPATMLDLSPALASIGTSVFWALMAAGRYLAVARARRGSSTCSIIVGGSLTGAIALAVAAAVSAASPTAAFVTIGVAVVAIAPSYGIIAGLALDRLTDESAADAVGMLVACGAIGGLTIPLVVLFTSADPASPATFAICAGLLLVVAVLVGYASHPRTRTPNDTERLRS